MTADADDEGVNDLPALPVYSKRSERKFSFNMFFSL